VFERFTERARQVVVFAQDEARSLKHNYIGTEHLLLGLLREEEGLAARVLEGLDVSLEHVRVEVERIIGVGEESATGMIPFTPRAKKVLELALREARALRHNFIGTEHILLGVVRENKGVASEILRASGLDADDIRAEVRRLLSGPGRVHERGAVRHNEFFAGQSPPLAPDVLAEIARLGQEKQRALERQQFDLAAALRDREQRLIDAANRFIEVWNEEKNELT